MAGDVGVHQTHELRVLIFNSKAVPVGIGDQQRAQAKCLHLPQERLRVRPIADQMRQLAVQADDVKAGESLPVIETVEVELAVNFAHAREQLGPGGVQGQSVGFAIAGGHQLVPQRVVVVQIE